MRKNKLHIILLGFSAIGVLLFFLLMFLLFPAIFAHACPVPSHRYWHLNPYLVTSVTVNPDGTTTKAEHWTEYMIVYSDPEEEALLDKWRSITHKTPAHTAYCYGMVLETDKEGKPVKQDFHWRKMIQIRTLDRQLKEARRVLDKLPVDSAPYNFMVVVYYPWIKMYRVLLHPEYSRDQKTYLKILGEIQENLKEIEETPEEAPSEIYSPESLGPGMYLS